MSDQNQPVPHQVRQDDSRTRASELDSRMKRVIEQLFLRMSSIYGNKWTTFASKEVENFAKREWYDAVTQNNLTPEQIRQALDTCRDTREWPPTISEFLELAKPQPVPLMHQEFKNQLPPPEISEEKVNYYRKKLREILSDGSVLKDPYN